jgi:hypothetical protein
MSVLGLVSSKSIFIEWVSIHIKSKKFIIFSNLFQSIRIEISNNGKKNSSQFLAFDLDFEAKNPYSSTVETTLVHRKGLQLQTCLAALYYLSPVN